MTTEPKPQADYPRLIYSPTQASLHIAIGCRYATLTRFASDADGHRLAACWNLCRPWSTEAIVAGEARTSETFLQQVRAATAPSPQQAADEPMTTIRGLLDALVRIEDLATAGVSHTAIAREAQAALWVASGRVAG